MSNYVKATNFATKDTLPTGDSNKIVKGTEIDNEFNSIAGAISSKADIASPTFTGTPAGPTATAGSNTTQLATTAYVRGEVDSATSSLGNMSTQSKTSVDITGGTITGVTVSNITDLAIADGGTGASTAANARTNLGLGSLATLSAVGTAQITDANITPAKLNGAQSGSAPIYGVRAWGYFNSTTILGSGNIASISFSGGEYSVTFTTAMPNENYAITGSYGSDSGDTFVRAFVIVSKSSSGFVFQIASGATSSRISIMVVG
jgi:hypothetical protein